MLDKNDVKTGKKYKSECEQAVSNRFAKIKEGVIVHVVDIENGYVVFLVENEDYKSVNAVPFICSDDQPFNQERYDYVYHKLLFEKSLLNRDCICEGIIMVDYNNNPLKIVYVKHGKHQKSKGEVKHDRN